MLPKSIDDDILELLTEQGVPMYQFEITNALGLPQPNHDKPEPFLALETVTHDGTIRAIGPGKVESVGSVAKYGNVIVLEYASGESVAHVHMASFVVKKGEVFNEGKVLGKPGPDYKVGPHLTDAARWSESTGILMNIQRLTERGLVRGTFPVNGKYQYERIR